MAEELNQREDSGLREQPRRETSLARVQAVPWLIVIALIAATAWLTWRAFFYQQEGDPVGSAMLAFFGLITSIWAEKFDHAAAVTNFVVAPLSLLSGTFYSIDSLAPAFQAVSHANPFFYVISGFRSGFIGVSDSPVALGAALLLGINFGLWALCYVLLKKGWKLKN